MKKSFSQNLKKDIIFSINNNFKIDSDNFWKVGLGLYIEELSIDNENNLYIKTRKIDIYNKTQQVKDYIFGKGVIQKNVFNVMSGKVSTEELNRKLISSIGIKKFNDPKNGYTTFLREYELAVCGKTTRLIDTKVEELLIKYLNS